MAARMFISRVALGTSLRTRTVVFTSRFSSLINAERPLREGGSSSPYIQEKQTGGSSSSFFKKKNKTTTLKKSFLKETPKSIDFTSHFQEQIKKPSVDGIVDLWKLFPGNEKKASQREHKRLLMERYKHFPLKMQKQIARKIFILQYGDKTNFRYHGYHIAFDLLQKCGLWRELITLLNDLISYSQKDKVPFAIFCFQFYMPAIIACFNGDQKEMAKTLLNEFVENGGPEDFNPEFFTNIIHSAYTNQFYEEVIEIMDLQLALNVLSFDKNQHLDVPIPRTMANTNRCFTGFTERLIKKESRLSFVMTIKSCHELKEYDKALEYIEIARNIFTDSNDISSPLYHVIINTFANCGEWELSGSYLRLFLKSQSLLRKKKTTTQTNLKKKDIKEEISNQFCLIFNTVLKSCAYGNRPDIALKLLKCMEEGKYGEFGEHDECKEKVLIPKPDSKSYFYVLKGYMHSFDLQKGFHFFNDNIPIEMKKQNIGIYTILMENATVEKDYHLVLHLYHELKMHNIYSTLTTFGPVLNACSKINDEASNAYGLEVIEDMLDRRDDEMRMQHNNSKLKSTQVMTLTKLRSVGGQKQGYIDNENDVRKVPFIPLPVQCLIPAITLCERAGDNMRAFQFQKEFQFNYPSIYPGLS